MNERFLIRTFGCQMNEHDSERIGGMLRADGMTPTDDVGDAKVIVLPYARYQLPANVVRMDASPMRYPEEALAH